MSWKRRAERAYHHGNLREALIQAARELIKEKGPAGFTFADAARSAGGGSGAIATFATASAVADGARGLPALEIALVPD
jgi:hypothetical protein